MKKTLDAVAKTTDVAPVDASVEVDGTSATVKVSSDGIELKRDELSKALLAAYATDNRTIPAPVQTAHPKISNAAAEAAKATAVKMMSDPLTVTYGGKQWTFSPKDIGKMIVFQSVEPTGAAVRSGSKAWTLVPAITETQAEKTVAPKLGAAIGTPARDARFKTRGGSVTIIASKDGIGPDLGLLAEDITSVLKDSENSTRTVEIKTTVVSPKLTTEKAREMGV